MVYCSTVLYPNEEASTFDVDYYLNVHMPLVHKCWGKHGLRESTVIRYDTSYDGSKRYTLGAVLTWESKESIKAAVASEDAKAVFADVPNFSSLRAHFLVGDLVMKHP
jgi:uncharacterized protein (TIGR02118 family)